MSPQSSAVPAVAAAVPDEDARRLMAAGCGDEAALTALIERWQGPLVSFFYRSLGSHAEAEDLAQETFVRLYRAAPGYEPRAKFTTFLFHVARRLLLNELRRRRRKPAEATDPADLPAHADAAIRATAEARELEEAFRTALEALPEKQRSAILLRQQQEFSYEEIATALDASVPAVKSWIFRARTHLKAALADLR